MSKKVYYVIAGERRTAGVDIRTSNTGEWYLSAMTALSLLNTSTGLMTKHALSCNNQIGDYLKQIDGVSRSATVKFAQLKHAEENGGNVWCDFDSFSLRSNLTFNCVGQYLHRVIMSFDDSWDLCLRTTILNTGELAYKYYLVSKGTYEQELLYTHITLCPFLRCYLDVMAKMQNRAKLIGLSANTEEFFAVTTKRLLGEFDKLSDNVLRKLPCDLALQSCQSAAQGVKLDNGHACLSYAFCCDASTSTIIRAMEQKKPFLFFVIHKRGKSAESLQQLLYAVQQHMPTAVVRLV